MSRERIKEDDRLMSVSKAALYLDVKPVTIRRWCAAGALRSVNLGVLLRGHPSSHMLRVFRADILRMVEAVKESGDGI